MTPGTMWYVRIVVALAHIAQIMSRKKKKKRSCEKQ